jgi:transposase
MTAKKCGSSPDQQRKYDETFKAEALRLALESWSPQAAARELGIIPKLLCHWQQAQVVTEVGSMELAYDPEVRTLCATNKRLAQGPDILKKALAIFAQPTP